MKVGNYHLFDDPTLKKLVKDKIPLKWVFETKVSNMYKNWKFQVEDEDHTSNIYS